MFEKAEKNSSALFKLQTKILETFILMFIPYHIHQSANKPNLTQIHQSGKNQNHRKGASEYSAGKLVTGTEAFNRESAEGVGDFGLI